MTNERVSLAGTHKAKVVDHEFGIANDKEQVALMLQIVGGDHDGKSIAWFGYFSDKTAERTLESLRYCGWDTDDLAQLDGIYKNEVEIVVEDEEYQGKWRSRVKWINRASKLSLKNTMDANALKAFSARMRSQAVASRLKANPPAQQGAASKPAQASNAPRSQPAPRQQPMREPGDDGPDYGPDAPFHDDMTF